ncbi:hemicentin-2-like [Phymastichus coffea]|uniref:hemicentin-2-like n=1 Tax=Phymastichus coffea TaxID=108790 RepID=UPI00273A87BA|nr:hemicentin-2-like [Phymastichus coffea]
MAAGGSSPASSNGPTRPPHFDDASARNVTVVVGQSAELSCHVKQPADRTVSWMRQRDLHILTSSVHTYTGDARFSARNPEGTDEWRLRIGQVQSRDAGVYECQINTEPKLSLAFALRVEAAQATIREPADVYAKEGSTISLSCAVNVRSSPPSSVAWHRGSAVLDFDSARGGISLETEQTEAGTTSKLLLTRARLDDSGNYSCVPSNAKPASVAVHVLDGRSSGSSAPAVRQLASRHSLQLCVCFACFRAGEPPAAWQRGRAARARASLLLVAALVLAAAAVPSASRGPRAGPQRRAPTCSAPQASVATGPRGGEDEGAGASSHRRASDHPRGCAAAEDRSCSGGSSSTRPPVAEQQQQQQQQ